MLDESKLNAIEEQIIEQRKTVDFEIGFFCNIEICENP